MNLVSINVLAHSITRLNKLIITHLLTYSGHCWDPNEEYNLRKVIDNVSVTKFETTIKNIGKSMIETGEWRKILVPDEQWYVTRYIILNSPYFRYSTLLGGPN